MAVYDCWIDYYDLVHHGVPGDVEFYVAQALRADGETLEIGCGTGRITLPMAMSGVNVTALDNSPAMLDLLRKKKRSIGRTSGRLKTKRADMLDFDLGKTFQFIAMPYRTFMHAQSPEDQEACLRAVHRHLDDDGTFILDTWAPKMDRLHAAIRNGQRLVGRYEIPETDITLVHWHAVTCDEERQQLIEEHLFHEVDETGAVVHTASLPLIRTWTTPRELLHLVRIAGFEPDAVFGDFHGAPLCADSDNMIWVLRKQV